MSRNPKPIFVQKRIYRQRRLADAAKLLPVFGCALILLPLLWQTGGEQQARTTGVMLYLFLVWVLSGSACLVDIKKPFHTRTG